MSHAQLHGRQQAGVVGFVGCVEWLTGMGGSQVFTGNGVGPSSGVEAQLAASGIAARAHAVGMKVYLGFNLVNYLNTQTPLGEWFDDAEWANVVVPAVQGVAGAAHELGFDGIAMDGELYPQQGNARTATWSWDYPANTHTEQQVRSEVTARGAQLMTAILAAFPGVQIADYAASFPDTWDAYSREQNGAGSNVFATNVDINFWDGMTSVEGYSAIWFYDETFYKDTGLSAGTAQTWNSALDYQDNSVFALFSKAFSNWSYAADRVNVSPSAWIDGDAANEGPWAAPRPPSYVATQLQAFHDWAMGGAFADFAYAPIESFDYSPYQTAIQAAAAATPVDDPPPSLTINSLQVQGDTATITGTATDSYALRVIRWSTPNGATGTAQLNWNITSGNYNNGYNSQTDWTASDVPLTGATQITLTAENTHGLTTTTTTTTATATTTTTAAATATATAPVPIAEDVPTSWLQGQAQAVTVTLYNDSNTTWVYNGPNPYHLGVHFANAGGGYGHNTWYTDQRIALPSNLAPGKYMTMSFNVTAPATATGNMVLEMQMVEEQVAWLPAVSDTDVTVSASAAPFCDPASFSPGPPVTCKPENYAVAKDVPTSWLQGQTQAVTVTLYNDSNTTWVCNGPNPYHLGVHFANAGGGYGHNTWYTDQRVALPSNLAPGKYMTMSFNVTAPATTTGDLVLEMQMVEEQVAWLPAISDTYIGVN